jgi:ubiquinone/menaquinone biosynthesis C-methylase UbiE
MSATTGRPGREMRSPQRDAPAAAALPRSPSQEPLDVVAPIEARSFSAAQAFITSVKKHWHTQVFPALRAEYEQKVAVRPAKPQTVGDVGAVLDGSTLYQYFAWLERHMQRLKYAGRYGLVPWHQQQRQALEQSLKQAPADRLELHPELEMPRYYTSCDIHQHPGGVWSDTVAGYVYQRAASTTTPLAGERHADMHQRFTDIIGRRAPAPKRVLDMGCGFGKSSAPIKAHFPDAEVDGVDLSAPCLQVAALSTPGVRYRQLNAAETDYPDAHFDLVTSTMFLHEMPPPMIEKTLAEAARVLQPGGKMMHLDFCYLPDLFSRFIHYTHGRRNNEPFMEPLAELDLVGMLERLGFRNISIEPFEESEGTLSPDYKAWRYPWTVISAERV